MNRPAGSNTLAQETLTAFATADRDGGYRRERGRLRQWLFGIARKQVVNWHRRRRPEVQVPRGTNGTDFYDRIGDERQHESIWDHEWRERKPF